MHHPIIIDQRYVPRLPVQIKRQFIGNVGGRFEIFFIDR